MIEVRPCRSEPEKRLSVEIYNEVCSRDAITMEEAADWEAAMTHTAEFVAFLDSEPVGSAAAAIMPTNPEIVFALVTVLPAGRGRGAGTALYRTASEWAREHGRDLLETRIAEDDEASLAFASRRGFEEFSRNAKLVLELDGAEIPPTDPPPGVQIVTLAERPELEDALYEIHCETTPDIPGVGEWTAPSRAHFAQHHLHGPGNRPDAIFIALEDGKAAGYAKLRFTNARPGIVQHQMTGVKHAHRGRGIASTLKHAQLRWAKENGFERLETENEARNDPILRINAKFGYRPAPGHVFLRGPLAR